MAKMYLSMFADMMNNDSESSKGFLEFLVYFMFFYGIYCTLCKIFRILWLIWKHGFRGCCVSKNKTMEKYGGPGSWALVTGGSDGIGLAYCHSLAK